MGGYTPSEELAIALREFIGTTDECNDGPDCRLRLAEELLELLTDSAA